MKSDKFECDGCGCCCKAGMFSKKGAEILDSLGFDRGDGVCIHLGEDNLCKIYEDRPEVCRVDLTYDRLYKDKMTREEYHNLTHRLCDYYKQIINHDRG